MKFFLCKTHDHRGWLDHQVSSFGLYQLVVSNCCIKLLYQLVSNCRMKLLYQIVVSTCCFKLLYQLVVSTCCFKLLYQLVVSNVAQHRGQPWPAGSDEWTRLLFSLLTFNYRSISFFHFHVRLPVHRHLSPTYRSVSSSPP